MSCLWRIAMEVSRAELELDVAVRRCRFEADDVQLGVPATQSLENITKAARAAQGKKGGVIRVAYLTALAPKLGDNLSTSISAAGGGEGTIALAVDEVSPMLTPSTYTVLT
jgi:hypothetical protein